VFGAVLRLCRRQDGLYLMQEGMTDTYDKMELGTHPALLGALRHAARRWRRSRDDAAFTDPKGDATSGNGIAAGAGIFPMAAMNAAWLANRSWRSKHLMIDSVKNRYHAQRPRLSAPRI
jgi:hypothetical protein